MLKNLVWIFKLRSYTEACGHAPASWIQTNAENKMLMSHVIYDVIF